MTGSTTVSKKGNEILFETSNTNFPTRIVNNDGAIEFYSNIKEFIFFDKEVLDLKVVRTPDEFIILKRNDFGGYDRNTISIAENRIDYKRGLLTTYFEVK